MNKPEPRRDDIAAGVQRFEGFGRQCTLSMDVPMSDELMRQIDQHLCASSFCRSDRSYEEEEY